MHLFCVLQTRPSLLPVAYLLFYHTKSLHTHHKFCSRCFLEDSSVENSRFTFCQQKWVFIGWSATRDWTLETEEVSGGWITQSAGGQRARMTLGIATFGWNYTAYHDLFSCGNQAGRRKRKTVEVSPSGIAFWIPI